MVLVLCHLPQRAPHNSSFCLRYTSIYLHVVGSCEQLPTTRPCSSLEDLGVLVSHGSRISWLQNLPGSYAKVHACSGTGTVVPQRHDKTSVLETGGSWRHYTSAAAAVALAFWGGRALPRSLLRDDASVSLNQPTNQPT